MNTAKGHKMGYKCKYFNIKELTHPDMRKALPERTLWILFDERLLRCADLIRELYGACTINTAALDKCGLVPFDSTRDAKYSPHKYARGLDLHILTIEREAAKIADTEKRKQFKIAEYNKVRERLMLDRRFDVLNFEANIGWLHIDTYNRDNRLFNP